MDPGEAQEILERTPRVLRSLLGGLSEGWAVSRPSSDAWSAIDVVGHLIHGERTDWIPRLRVIMEHGEARPFDPFDREGHAHETAGRTIGELLGGFEQMRAESLSALAAARIDEEMLGRRGTHPDLGAVTLSELIATWAAHDLAHLAQLAETLAKRYREDVGPWRAYLPILDRD